jgi:hypothetical protein
LTFKVRSNPCITQLECILHTRWDLLHRTVHHRLRKIPQTSHTCAAALQLVTLLMSLVWSYNVAAHTCS